MSAVCSLATNMPYKVACLAGLSRHDRVHFRLIRIGAGDDTRLFRILYLAGNSTDIDIMKLQALIWLGALLSVPGVYRTDIAQADVWRCGNRYTNVPTAEEDCSLVKGSVVCGTGGNKFFSPNAERVDDRGPCQPSESSSSPFVNEAKITAMVSEAQIQRDRERVAEERKRRNRYRARNRTSDAAILPELQQLPSEQELNCIMNEMLSGGQVDGCGVDIGSLFSTLSGVSP